MRILGAIVLFLLSAFSTSAFGCTAIGNQANTIEMIVEKVEQNGFNYKVTLASNDPRGKCFTLYSGEWSTGDISDPRLVFWERIGLPIRYEFHTSSGYGRQSIIHGLAMLFYDKDGFPIGEVDNPPAPVKAWGWHFWCESPFQDADAHGPIGLPGDVRRIAKVVVQFYPYDHGEC